MEPLKLETEHPPEESSGRAEVVEAVDAMGTVQ